jgi:hypothetical protein
MTKDDFLNSRAEAHSFTFGSFRPLLTKNSKQFPSDVKISENSLYFSP